MNPIFQYTLINEIWKNHLRKCPKCGHQIIISKKKIKYNRIICPKCKNSFPFK